MLQIKQYTLNYYDPLREKKTYMFVLIHCYFNIIGIFKWTYLKTRKRIIYTGPCL